MSEFFHHIDSNWTLFLDRDGVINKRPPGDYIKKWEEFEFLPGVQDALNILSKKFTRIIVITNQQGIGKGLMTEEDLQKIHQKMKAYVTKNGGRIDAIYYCPDLAGAENNCRKPGTFMAEQAKRDFPEIDFLKSVMVGDTLSDMEFGRNTGMKTVFINSDNSFLYPATYDYSFIDLLAFAKAIGGNR